MAKPDPAVYAQKLHDDFCFFLHELWAYANLPTPSLVQYDIAHWLQHGPHKRIVRAFRGISKTWITIAYILWRLYRNGNERIILVSQSLGHSRKSLHLARQWIDAVPYLKHLRPRPGTRQRDSADAFDVGTAKWDRQPSVSAYGITGQITGCRASLIVPDDVETKENTLTADQRNMLIERCTEFEFILSPGGDIVYLGSPHHEDSLYDTLSARGYACRTWPARYPTPDMTIPDVSPTLLKRIAEGANKPGDTVWPERFDHDRLTETELKSGRTNFLMQMMMVSNLADEDLYPLRLDDLIVLTPTRDKAPADIAWGTHTSRGPTTIEDIPSVGFGGDAFRAPAMVSDLWLPFQGNKGFIDPAGRGKDEIAWAGAGQLHGYLYVKTVGGLHGGPTAENLDTIVQDLKHHNITEVAIETNFGGDMLIMLIQPVIARHALKPGDDDAYPNGWNCYVYGVHASGQKEKRIIETLEPVMNQHRLVISHQVAKDRILMHQLTRLTSQRGCLEHDDRLDALSGAVSQFRDLLGQDATQQTKRREEERIKELLAKYDPANRSGAKPDRFYNLC